MLLPGPECLMGPCTASHCCCLHRHTLPCATFRSPHTAGGFHFVIGCWQITGLPCCCQARNLPWVPVPPPHAAARSRFAANIFSSNRVYSSNSPNQPNRIFEYFAHLYSSQL
ncbi:unnamed protein product, partial [Staurois parvus]